MNTIIIQINYIHSTLKTEIIPSEYVFITTNSTNGNDYSYLYNLKTKEKKLFYIDKGYNDASYKYDYEYYDINGNLTTNWTDENMQANGFYEITNNRFGETFYTRKLDGYDEIIIITKGNDYIQKAYKYSLTQPEIINKKDRGIYLFKIRNGRLISRLCFQNEYYETSNIGYYMEEDLLNYDSNGRIIFDNLYSGILYFHFLEREDKFRSSELYTDTIYFKLNDKSFIKPTWQEFANKSLNYIKKERGDKYTTNFHYSKEDTEYNIKAYKELIDSIDFLGFIPIEEFEYYLLAD